MRTCTPAQLIAELEQLPKGARLAFASDYGDRCHTQQVHFIRGYVEKSLIEENAYSDSGYATSEDGEGEESIWIIS